MTAMRACSLVFLASCTIACGTKATAPTTCASDSDCSVDNPRCDATTARCVPCLPANDNCGAGMHCARIGTSYRCGAACNGNDQCSRGSSCCGGVCTDTASDASNCGTCGTSCTQIAHTVTACRAGGCVVDDCDVGYSDCDKALTNGCEIHSASDPRNCGLCGTVCPSGPRSTASCESGQCRLACTSGWADCDGDAATGCETPVGADVRNCGGCGVVCSAPAHGAARCSDGACTLGACAGGFADCNGVADDGCEADLANDPARCGACGTACPAVMNGTVVCSQGACGVGACVAGFGDCDRGANNGCEAALTSDERNCGACGVVCAGGHSQQACQAGACQIAQCDDGFGDCNHTASDGCESSVLVDVKNCGACGSACQALPNAAVVCLKGVCSPGACLAGFAHCSQKPQDGCETDITTPANCGKCGNACNLANATPACRSGACAVGMCSAGFADCDRAPGNGCESQSATDVNNCGGCGKACSYANGQGACAASTCSLAACNAGFGDCDKDPGNGCEAGLQTDAANCGACGNACPNDRPSCSDGVCVDAWLPVGIQQDVDVGKLTGWSECYRDHYDNSDTAVADILKMCSGGRLMLACAPSKSDTLTLLAWGDRADVLFDVGQGEGDSHDGNGVSWYFNDSYSWGFFSPGDGVDRSSCDVADGDHPELRMCWHTGDGNINSGYRCGKNFLNGDGGWDRIIYQN